MKASKLSSEDEEEENDNTVYIEAIQRLLIVERNAENNQKYNNFSNIAIQFNEEDKFVKFPDGEFSVMSQYNKRLQKFCVHEEKELAFVYDNQEECIVILNTSSNSKMVQNKKVPKIDSGAITDMYID